MRSHAKASAARSNKASRIAAPKAKLALVFGAALALVLALGVTLASAVVPTVTVENAQNVTATSALAKGTVDPQGKETNCRFEYVTQAQLDENVTNGVGEFEGAGGEDCNGNPHTGTGTQDVEANLTGLAPNTVYHLRLVASNEDGQSEAVATNTFTTTAVAPSAATIPAFALEGGNSALLGGRVNPHNSATTYWIEYGTTTGYGNSFPAAKNAAAGAGGVDKVVTQEVSGLTPGTVYHYRLVAKNAKGETPGEDMTFKTASAPLQPAAGSCSNEQFRAGPSAALPDCRAYELVTTPDFLGSSAFSVAAPSATHPWTAAATNGERVLWGTRAVVAGTDSSGVYDHFLSTRTPAGWTSELVSPPGSKISIGATFAVYADPSLERIIWNTFGAKLDPEDLDPVTQENHVLYQDIYRREPNGTFTRISRGSMAEPVTQDFPFFGGGSADLRKVAFGDQRQLEPDAPGGGAYLRVGQTTTLISKAEDGTPLPGAGPQGMSADGSTVAITTSESLYIYNEDLPHLVHVADGLFGTFHFLSMAPDGSKLLFATSGQLTPDDADSNWDIYEYDLNTHTLKRISAPTGAPAGPGPGNGAADVEPVAVSSDQSTVYFTSPEQLDGSKGTSGEQNLYIYQGGVTRFAASLGSGGSNFQLAPASPKLLFDSGARLTSYDNAGHTEVYVYDAESGVLTCASCRPSGEPPIGDSSLQGGSPREQFTSPPLHLTNSDEHGGKIFFHSADPVLAQDVNDSFDVYEFDAASGTESLISTGKSPVNSVFYGSGGDGRDLFFFTVDSLVSGDPNQGSFKVYDARVGGGFPELVKPAPCEGEACRSTTSPVPAAAAPTTPNFIGPGNPKPKHAKKHKAKKHKTKKRRGHQKHQGKSHKRDGNSNGRTGR